MFEKWQHWNTEQWVVHYSWRETYLYPKVAMDAFAVAWFSCAQCLLEDLYALCLSQIFKEDPSFFAEEILSGQVVLVLFF